LDTEPLSKETYVLGIDLGTTHSVAAVWMEGRPQALPIQNAAPRELLRSVVYVESPDRIHVGEHAWNRRKIDPGRFIASVKSRMGTDETWVIDGVTYTPEHISSLIVAEVVARARQALHGAEITNLIVTVPARFSPKARKATEEAVRMAGYPPGDLADPQTHTLLLESDAAALAYLRDAPVTQTVLVYDMGGGTFDVSVMQFVGGTASVADRLRSLGPAGGDPRLGGDVFDQRLFERMVEHFNTGGKEAPAQRTYPGYFDFTKGPPPEVDARQWVRARQDLLDTARAFKQVLGDVARDPELPYETMLPEVFDTVQPVPFAMNRTEFETLIADRLDDAATEVRRLLAELKVDAGDVDRVILAGGSTRIPAIRAQVEEMFGYRPHDTLEPDKAIAIGAVIYWALDFLSGVRRADRVGPTQYLTVPIGLKVTSTVRESIMGDIGHDREVRDTFHVVLPRGMTCPGSETVTVSTTRDRQRTLRFQLYQQESEIGSGSCHPDDFMGGFELKLPDGALQPKGVPRVDITFDLNANGTEVAVSAIESRTGLHVDSQFQVAGRGVPIPEDNEGTGIADIVVAMDTTGSMHNQIAEMKRLTQEFAARVGASGIDFRLALIDFRDLKRNERMTVHPFTADVDEYQRRINTMTHAGGGDTPESALDALERALELDFRDGAQKVLILITDAPPHDPAMSGRSASQVADLLREAGAAIYIVAPPGLRTLYGRLIDADRGRFYEMGERFDGILDNIATEIRDISIV
jgi:molecular chaperone DnaK